MPTYPSMHTEDGRLLYISTGKLHYGFCPSQKVITENLPLSGCDSHNSGWSLMQGFSALKPFWNISLPGRGRKRESWGQVPGRVQHPSLVLSSLCHPSLLLQHRTPPSPFASPHGPHTLAWPEEQRTFKTSSWKSYLWPLLRQESAEKCSAPHWEDSTFQAIFSLTKLLPLQKMSKLQK